MVAWTGSSYGDTEKWSDPGFILKVESKGFAVVVSKR